MKLEAIAVQYGNQLGAASTTLLTDLFNIKMPSGYGFAWARRFLRSQREWAPFPRHVDAIMLRFSLRLSAPTWTDKWDATRKDQEAAENVLKAEAEEYGSAPAADLDPTSLALVSLQTLIARPLKIEIESVKNVSSDKTVKQIVNELGEEVCLGC